MAKHSPSLIKKIGNFLKSKPEPTPEPKPEARPEPKITMTELNRMKEQSGAIFKSMSLNEKNKLMERTIKSMEDILFDGKPQKQYYSKGDSIDITKVKAGDIIPIKKVDKIVKLGVICPVCGFKSKSKKYKNACIPHIRKQANKEIASGLENKPHFDLIAKFNI